MLKQVSYTVTLLSVLIFTVASAQSALSVPKQTPKSLTSSMARLTTTLDIYNNPMDEEAAIKGNPYLGESYKMGTIRTGNGNFSGVEMRYNIFYDQIEFKVGDSVFGIAPDQFVKRIELSDQIFVVDQFKLKGKPTLGYFVRLDSGAVTLLVRMEVILRERQEPKPMQPEGAPARFDRMPDIYYYKISSAIPMEIRSIQKLIDSLPDFQKEMEIFSKREKISAKNPEELTSFIQYYNSLKMK